MYIKYQAAKVRMNNGVIAKQMLIYFNYSHNKASKIKMKVVFNIAW